MLAVLEVVAISASRISPAGRDSGVVLRLSGASAWCLTSGRPGGCLIGGFGSAPLFHCYFPVLSAPLGSVWLHVMLESCSCLQGFMGVIVTDFSIPLFKELSLLVLSCETSSGCGLLYWVDMSLPPGDCSFQNAPSQCRLCSLGLPRQELFWFLLCSVDRHSNYAGTALVWSELFSRRQLSLCPSFAAATASAGKAWIVVVVDISTGTFLLCW
ncbi:hypothetical protein YC2023_104190 [Brassica napus]